MFSAIKILVVCFMPLEIFCWEALPEIPTGRRSQFFLLQNDGGYKYGYDTGDGSAGKQSGDSANQVEGHYFYKTASGQNIDLKYTAGTQGFVPEGLEALQVKTAVLPAAAAISLDNSNDQANTGDASYNFNFDTGTYKRQESSDSTGNVQGSYTYSNELGTHDLQYIAGAETGFVARSGSLSLPNGLSLYAQTTPYKTENYSPSLSSASNADQTDVSYSFEYSTPDQSRKEDSDSSGTVRGSYTYRNEAGVNDLSYTAGSKTGFQVTGGSLAVPNGLKDSTVHPLQYNAPNPLYNVETYSSNYPYVLNNDGSYSFGYSAVDQSRREQSDANGNIQGTYTFINEGGAHDLRYVAGSSTGFQVTGGSLSNANKLGEYPVHRQQSTSFYSPLKEIYNSFPLSDGSYSFRYATADQSRSETADASGNVQGRYSYIDNAGAHDLSYVAGSNMGYQVTGGSLATPTEVQNSASYVTSNSINPKAATSSTDSETDEENSKKSSGFENTVNDEDQSNTGDASYSFTIDTDEYKRSETSDARGNVQGNFAYKNSVGTHDLSYIAGSDTGFVGTGGSLKHPPGLKESQLDRAGFDFSGRKSVIPRLTSQTITYLPPKIGISTPATQRRYSLGNVSVRTYLPPTNNEQKVGYVFDTY